VKNFRPGLIFLLCYTICITAAGQQSLGKLKFSRIEVNAGLSNSNITCFLQDSNGFLWIGTRDGLNKYDGYDFKVYRNDQEDSTSLLKNNIYVLFEDSHQTLWVSTRGGGLHYYDKKYDRFVRVTQFSSYCVVASISEDQQKNLWISGMRNEHAFAARLDHTSTQWQSFDIFPSAEPVTFFKQKSENEFYVGVRRTGFFKWNKKENTHNRFLPDDNDRTNSMGNGFLRAVLDDKENFWISTADGLTKFNSRTEKFKSYTPYNIKDQPSLSLILDLCVDGHFIWLGTENGGLLRLDTRTDQFSNFLMDKNDPTSLSDNSVWTLYKDHQQRIWVGTFSKGICLLDKMKEKFSELNIPLENDIVNAIRIDHKNRLWIGTEGGLAVKDGNVIRYYKHEPNKTGGLANNPVLSIFEDSRQQMWFGTWAGGINRYDEKKNNFITYGVDTSNPDALQDGNVFSIIEYSRTKQLLISSFRGLNILIDEKIGKFEHHPDERHASNNVMSTIYEDRKGNIWTGSNAELNLYDIKTRKRKRYYVGSLNDSTTVGGYINCILEDKKGRLWVGASNGLHLLKDKEYIIRYSTKNGLPSNIIRGMLEDNQGNLWLSTTQGLSKFNPESQVFKNYDVNDGLLSNEFKPNACFKNKDGKMFFGGKGIIVFHPDSLRTNPYLPSVFITDLKLFNKSVQIGGVDNILKQHIRETKEISLAHDYNFFTINYVALNFTTSHKNQYAYKLDGFDENWTYVGSQRSATFTNLDAGTYTFHVKACNNDGLWNEQGTTLTIHVLPPWWETWWFRTYVFFTITGAALGYYWIRVRTIHQQNKRLENLVSVRTKELILREEEIKAQNYKLLQQREELAAQNEELLGSQEEISAQRDLVSVQNAELQKARGIIEEQNKKITIRNENLEKEVEKRTAKLTEYNQQLEQFAFISAHNLRAPVARILGLGQILDLSDKDIKENKFICDKIVSTTRELDRVVRDLNTILEVRKDDTSARTEVDFETELSMVRSHLEKEITETHTTILADFSKVKSIQTVKPYLDSIIHNLVSNAIKYRHKNRNPIIKITTDIFENFVCLSVQDNGLGIDLNLYGEKLFVLYNRFHLNIEGKGMGLYLVKTQVTALDGKIEVESEVDNGTTFKVYLKNII
jgi:ligand-binding sensor domain-containing protein/signal transduction histidine kinase